MSLEEALVPKSTVPDNGYLSTGLDYYKLTMGQLIHDKEPGAVTTFSFHNRGTEHLLGYVSMDALSQRFADLQVTRWTSHELHYLGSLTSQGQPVFYPKYLEYLATNSLPPVEVTPTHGLRIRTIGTWALATFWETLVLSELSEAYTAGYLAKQGIGIEQLAAEGDRRLTEKIARLRAHPEVKFADFGTRRRFSWNWQKHVLERLVEECPDSITGTSNVALAADLGLQPVGTFAHEMPMVYAGLAEARGENIRESHARFLEDWYARYGTDLSIALTDTFTTDHFFADFTLEQALKWRGLRQDSGDPIMFGEKAIRFYKQFGIDPKGKTIVFSDALDIGKIIALEEHFRGRIQTLFGWGTTLTNDLGIPVPNIVMKATRVDGQETAKLSDDKAKTTGSPAVLAKYRNVFTKARET